MSAPTLDPVAGTSNSFKRNPSYTFTRLLRVSSGNNLRRKGSSPVIGEREILLTDGATRLCSIDADSLPSSPSSREIITRHGTTYAWPWFENPDEVERADRYCAGGYHPTHIGDRFYNDRYVIRNKLGHGTSSTVWLAQNTLIDGEYVALKILTAEASTATNEVKIRAHLQSKSNPKHPGHAYIASSLDLFYFSGPNGYHLCLVDEVVGCNLDKCKQSGLPMWTFPIKVSRAIIAQVMLGLSYLHSLGVCHGGIVIFKDFIHQYNANQFCDF